MKTKPKVLSLLLMLSVSVACVACIFFLGSCAATGKSASPLTVGYGANLTPGLQLGNSNNSVHAILGYSKIEFKGGGGHSRNIQFGGQYRHSFVDLSQNGFWVGGEAAFIRLTSVVDNSSGDDFSANGFTLGPIAGYRFKIGSVPVSGFVSPSFLSFGDFKTSSFTSSGSSGSGFYGKIGIDIHFMELLLPNGR